MGTSFLDSKIQRLQREINTLDSQRAKAMKDESSAMKKINGANTSLSRTTSKSIANNKSREIERENKKVQAAKEKQAEILNKINKKNVELNKATTDSSKLRQKEQETLFKKQERRLHEYEKKQETLLNDANREHAPFTQEENKKEYDVFISHSADDKDYVEQLAQMLKEDGIKTWYDTDDIPWGGSIRQEIDKGLANSRYGIVIISPSFIKKHWTNYELNGILSKQSRTGRQMILPIWYNVTADIVNDYSPSISDMNALNTALTTKSEIVETVKKLIK